MKFFPLFTTFCLAILLSACSTTKKVDWSNRVGNYTYDQAVIELGPPDKVATLSDETKVAEWYRGRKSGVTLGLGTGSYSGAGYGRSGFGTGVGVGTSVPIAGGSMKVLRLTFSPDGKLTSWSK